MGIELDELDEFFFIINPFDLDHKILSSLIFKKPYIAKFYDVNIRYQALNGIIEINGDIIIPI